MIFAEGAPSESFINDDSRGIFHNAHEYARLYPDAFGAMARYCAPRVHDGYRVEAARRRIALRAGLRLEDHARMGPLRGFVDFVGPRRICGWAQNTEHPEAPVCLDVYAAGRLIGQTLANIYREDLECAGLGSGRHSFAFAPAAAIAPRAVITCETVQVRRSLDGAELANSADAQPAGAGIWPEATAPIPQDFLANVLNHPSR